MNIRAGAASKLSVLIVVIPSGCAPVPPPFMLTQPADQVATVGDTRTFAVQVAGVSPLEFQWYKNGDAIPGATFTTYTTKEASPLDDGASFNVVIRNSGDRSRATQPG